MRDQQRAAAAAAAHAPAPEPAPRHHNGSPPPVVSAAVRERARLVLAGDRTEGGRGGGGGGGSGGGGGGGGGGGDAKWVEGQGARCARSNGKSGTGWRCASAAVPDSAYCAHHIELMLRGAQTGEGAAEAGEGRGQGRGGRGGGNRDMGMDTTSTFHGLSAERTSGRWKAIFNQPGKSAWHVGTFDRATDAARAWDRMMVWCDLHGVVRKRRGGHGQVLDSSGIRASLNFSYKVGRCRLTVSKVSRPTVKALMVSALEATI